MKTLIQFRKPITHSILGITTLLGLSACNLTGFMDKPSGDIQLLDAARSCLDRGDYSCALEYYQQISVESDQKISELSMAKLANANLFKTSDLIESLGSGTGGISSFSFMAETLAARGKTSAAERVIIQKAYADATSSIQEPTLKAYMQFITAMTMMNQVLASAVGADGRLTATDIASNPTTCRNVGACGGSTTDCDSSSNLKTDILGGETEVDSTSGMNASLNWDSAPTVAKAIHAAEAANAASVILFGATNNNGLGEVFDALNGAGSSGATPEQKRCLKRKALLTVLFPNN